MAVDRLSMQFYSSLHPRGPHVQGIQFYLGNPGLVGLLGGPKTCTAASFGPWPTSVGLPSCSGYTSQKNPASSNASRTAAPSIPNGGGVANGIRGFMVGVGVGTGVYVGSATCVSVGLMVARSEVVVGVGMVAGVSDGGDMIVLVGAGVSASSEEEGRASLSPESSDPNIAMMTTSATRPTNPTPAHLTALLNNGMDLLGWVPGQLVFHVSKVVCVCRVFQALCPCICVRSANSPASRPKRI